MALSRGVFNLSIELSVAFTIALQTSKCRNIRIFLGELYFVLRVDELFILVSKNQPFALPLHKHQPCMVSRDFLCPFLGAFFSRPLVQREVLYLGALLLNLSPDHTDAKWHTWPCIGGALFSCKMVFWTHRRHVGHRPI